ncbi:acyltransferase domain-containing protein, partial [Kitasatospora sp. NPDC047058]|uniref:acyltransferase domain-containing protein n=1 Tax=Kitasatospora sp. NPDC047058 TaxID=3155620 RepID=UPI0033C3D1A3
MARALYENEPVFRATADECLAALPEGGTGDTLRALLVAGSATEEEAAALRRTALAQPALFVLEYALVRLWESWGVRPDALLGHSLGELVAACAAGVFAPADALRLVVLRGALMQERPEGAMLSVVADRASVLELLPDGLALAAHNGPRDCVVAGPHAAVGTFAALLAERGVVTHPVATSHAFHSPAMAPVVAEFTAAVAAVPRKAPAVPFVSNLTGTWITPEQAVDPAYWGRLVVSPVEFDAGVRTLGVEAGAVLVEVGPGPTLSSLARRILPGDAARLITSTLSHRQDGRHPVEAAQRALGQLWVHGYEPDWAAHHGGGRRRVELPTYPFQRRRYWLELRDGATAAARAADRRRELTDWFQVPSWERTALPEAPADRSGERWLVFADAVGVGRELAARLRAAGATVATVAAGDGWSWDGDGFTVDPQEPADYGRLLAALGEDGPVPDRIAHCWSLGPLPARHGPAQDAPDGPSGGVPDGWSDDRALRLGFDSLLLLAQALNALSADADRSLWVIGNGVHDVVGSEPLAPLRATVLGPCRVIPREHPRLKLRSVDLVLDGTPPQLHADRLLAEFAVAPAHPAVAHRGGHRWSQTFAPAPLPAVGPQDSALREDGVYVITGGTGGLGLALAEHLSRPGRRIALLARTPVPPQEDWERIAAPTTGPRTSPIGRAHD